jgi:hypothetical protein
MVRSSLTSTGDELVGWAAVAPIGCFDDHVVRYAHTARKLQADFEKNRGTSAFINAGLPAMTR